MSTCFSLVTDHVPGVRCLVFDVMLAYMLPHYEIMALCGIRAHLEHLVSIFLMRDIKWVAVLRDYCLGDPRGPTPPLLLYTLGTNLVEELNPISWTPLCSCLSLHHFCGSVLHLFSNSSADVFCALHSLHLYFPLPQAGFRCGYWVPCWSLPKISFRCVWLFSCKYTC